MAVAAAIRGPQATANYSPSTFMLVLISLFFLGDVVASVLLALAAMRGVTIGGTPAADDSGDGGTEDIASGGEGEDEGSDGPD